ncbi:hypothetical protein E2562_036820 [Oryza meyeriana var. granulata]|uniref:Uncharacterized protein n=1 Tax=Oryza meyeriana var. granulata TaxID=110450 RepID=A0A6G1E839_9ORYZ|nr:hypothetical protein E2562_036820 [Oryza meyeriana var. granulata]
MAGAGRRRVETDKTQGRAGWLELEAWKRRLGGRRRTRSAAGDPADGGEVEAFAVGLLPVDSVNAL